MLRQSSLNPESARQLDAVMGATTVLVSGAVGSGGSGLRGALAGGAGTSRDLGRVELGDLRQRRRPLQHAMVETEPAAEPTEKVA